MNLRIRITSRPASRAWRRLVLGISALGVLGLASFLATHREWMHFGTRASAAPTVPARRADIQVALTAAGQIQSAKNTIIECKLEALQYRNEGRTIGTSGASTIISILPEGSDVRQGEVLCQLDASAYEELVRQQSIELEESRKELLGSELDLAAAEVGLREYRDGVLQQLKQQYQGQIALADGAYRRQQDVLKWTERMVELKYAPLSRLSLEKQNLDRYRIDLDRSKLSLRNLQTYTAPKMIATLEARIEALRSVKTYYEMRLKRHEDQFALFKRQVEACTIRAPHDGFLIYANEEDDDTRIELGASVAQNQDLFFLPDLSNMEVETLINESNIQRIRDGMPAYVKIEALPDLTVEGHVVSVAPLPRSMRSRYGSDEVKNYVSRVSLHSVPEGLRPGMTAQVEIVTARVDDAIVIPVSAVASHDGRDSCYIEGTEGPQRRSIELGEVTMDLAEVRSGLTEGERVLVEPPSDRPLQGRADATVEELQTPAPPVATASFDTTSHNETHQPGL